MRRLALAALTVLCFIGLVGVPGAATAAPGGDACTGAVNNSTVQDLCERLETLENTNSQLKTKVVNKNSRIQELEFQLNNSRKQTGFDSGQADRMKAMGAWNPYEDEPAVFFCRDKGFGPVCYQYVGPGNGGNSGESFNGENAWKEVAKPKEQVREEGSFSFTLKYALPEMNTTYTASSFADYRQKTNTIAQKLNTPAGFTAWAKYNNGKRQSAETMSSGTTWFFVGLGILGMFGAAWVESRMHFFYNRKREKERQHDHGFFRGEEDSKSFLDRFVLYLNVFLDRFRR